MIVPQRSQITDGSVLGWYRPVMTDLELIHQFVRTHRLHESIPVDLAPLYDAYDVRLVDFSKAILGFCYASKQHTVIGINAHLHPYVQRAVLCHEIAHHLLKHPNSLYLRSINGSRYRHLEARAQEAAAIMLVPVRSLQLIGLSSSSAAELEDYFQVPAELIELRSRMAGLAI